jgi:hypothetical protein
VAEKIQKGVNAIPPVFGLYGLIFDTRKYVMDSRQPPRGQPRKIIGFHQDELSDWIADLACGHQQHVRHNPPWTERHWVTTAEGRKAHIGQELLCLACSILKKR